MKKITNLSLSDYKVYQSNIEVFADECSFSIQYDKFRDENDLPVRESVAREILDEEYDVTGDAADVIVSALYTKEWIISDDEVYLFKVNFIQAYRADEQGIRWMTHCPHDTVDYKHEIEETVVKHLPKGFTYNDEDETFWKNGVRYTFVNENDGSVSLVSADGIIEWF